MKAKSGKLGWSVYVATFLFRSLARLVYYARLVKFAAVNRKSAKRKGALIIACNHISTLDPVFLWCVLTRPAVMIAMIELWLKKRTRWVMKLLKHIPVDRKSPDSRALAMEHAARRLQRGGIIGIYPHGRCVSQQEDETMVPYQAGVYKLSLATGAPVLAAHIAGTDRMAPLKKDRKRGQKRFDPSAKVYLAFADDVMYARDYTDEAAFLAALRAQINSMAPAEPLHR